PESSSPQPISPNPAEPATSAHKKSRSIFICSPSRRHRRRIAQAARHCCGGTIGFPAYSSRSRTDPRKDGVTNLGRRSAHRSRRQAPPNPAPRVHEQRERERDAIREIPKEQRRARISVTRAVEREAREPHRMQQRQRLGDLQPYAGETLGERKED